MKTGPLVSIVIPCWNAERYIASAILSGLCQTWANIEIVVVDDGSTDGSVAAMERFRDRITLVETANRGACAARNTGLERSSGALIKFLDADDFLLPEAVARQVEALAGLDAGTFTIGRVSGLREETGIIQPHGQRSADPALRSPMERLMIDVPVNSTALYRRAMVEAIGGFRELPTRQDFDFFVRMVLAGYAPHEDGVPVYVYRNHASAGRLSGRRTADDYRAMAAMYDYYLGQEQGLRQAPPGMARGLGRSAWMTGRDALRAGYSGPSARLFELARQFDPAGCMTGSASYVAAARLLGPELAERLGQLRR